MFAIVGYFDKNSDKIIKSLWQGMADSNVCDYLINSDNNPHIKFAMFDEFDEDNVKKNLNLLCNETHKIKIHFKTYSFYPNETPFVCLDIAVSFPVLELHEKIIKSFYGDAEKRGYFEQGIWKPDIQLTVNIEKVKLNNAISYLSETKLPFDGLIEKIGLIEFHPAKQIFSIDLI